MPDASERIVIVGSGPAGYTAAIYAARANLAPLLFEGEADPDHPAMVPGGQLMVTTEVENYPGFPHGDLSGYLASALDPGRRALLAPHRGKGASGPEMMELFRRQAENFGTRIVPERVTAVDLRRRPFALASASRRVFADAVIAATGAAARYLGLPSERRLQNRGVSACAVCDGALPIFRGRPLVVVGGGDSAMEEATYLAKYASRVTIVHRRDTLRASKIMQDRVRRNPKIGFAWNTVVEEVLGGEAVEGARVRDVETDAVSTIPCAGFFLAIGHEPNTALFRDQLGMDEQGYLKTFGKTTATSVEGVFAAGDAADARYRQAVTAAGTGCMAALDAERWLEAQG